MKGLDKAKKILKEKAKKILKELEMLIDYFDNAGAEEIIMEDYGLVVITMSYEKNPRTDVIRRTNAIFEDIPKHSYFTLEKSIGCITIELKNDVEF